MTTEHEQHPPIDRRIHTESRLVEMEGKLLGRMDDRFEELKKLFMDAFPGGDPHGHRIAHEKVIKSSDRWEKIKFGVLEKITSGGVWAGMLFVALAVWEQFKHEVKK